MLIVAVLVLFSKPSQGVVLDQHWVKNGHTWRIQIETSQASSKTDSFGTVKVASGVVHKSVNAIPTINGIEVRDAGSVAVVDDEIAHWRRGDSWGVCEVPWLIRNFIIWIDGARIPVPKKYWDDIVDLGSEPESAASFSGGLGGLSRTAPGVRSLRFGPRTLLLLPEDDGTRVRVSLAQSDGHISQIFTWTISRTGKVDRRSWGSVD